MHCICHTCMSKRVPIINMRVQRIRAIEHSLMALSILECDVEYTLDDVSPVHRKREKLTQELESLVASQNDPCQGGPTNITCQ